MRKMLGRITVVMLMMALLVTVPVRVDAASKLNLTCGDTIKVTGAKNGKYKYRGKYYPIKYETPVTNAFKVDKNGKVRAVKSGTENVDVYFRVGLFHHTIANYKVRVTHNYKRERATNDSDGYYFTYKCGCGKKLKAITIENLEDVNEQSAQVVHDVLIKQKGVSIRIKGKKTSASKILEKLRECVGNTNKQGVLFQYSYTGEDGGYSNFHISGDDASLYFYSVKYFEKIVEINRGMMQERYELFSGWLAHDSALYPDEKTRQLRIIYDNLVAYLSQELNLCYGNDEITTISECSFEDVDAASQFIIERREFDKDYYDKVFDCEGDYDWTYYVLSFDEFAALPNLDELIEMSKIYDLNLPEKILYHQTFSEYSDAMKVYAIFYSEYFDCCCGEREGYYMIYDLKKKGSFKKGLEGMKTLYENKAVGVCSDYARYELLAFEQIGIKGYYNASSYLDHAWSVYKVKNSKGKTLWIPFDYGIGPGGIPGTLEMTEAEQYELYLAGVEGAPNYMNFTEEDFN